MIYKNLKYYLVFFLAIFIPTAFLSAENFSYSGCFEKTHVLNGLNIRMMGLQCDITVTGGLGQTYGFTVENIDSDAIEINSANSGTVSRNINNIVFQTTITSDPQIISLVPWYQPTDNFYFVALGDNRSTSATEINPIFTDFLDNINVINPYFTLNAGDLVPGTSSPSQDATLTSEYQLFLNALQVSETPQFTVPGNHDDNETDLNIYRSFLGSDNYSFDFGNTHFTMADSVSPGTSSGYMSDTMKTWLNTDLSSTIKTNKIVDFHHPLYLSSSSYGSFTTLDNRNEVAAILSNNNIDLLLNGHVHTYIYDYLDSTKISNIINPFYQLVSGGAGQVYGAGDDTYYHINLHHVQGNQITHHIIERNNFYISKQYVNNNDGTEESSTINVSNSDVIDWPWLRLKYKLAPTVHNIYAYDELGNYLSFQNKLLDNYHVAYLETSIPALSTRTITVAKKNKIHTGRNNTIDTNGEATYSEEPINTSTETSLTASINADSVNVNILEWQNDLDLTKKWNTQSTNTSAILHFNISNLSTGYLYDLKVNNKYYYKYYPDSNGIISFDYQAAGTDYTFELNKENTWLPSNLAVMPNSDGGPQIRIFDQNGQAGKQFYAYDQAWQGGYQILQSDLNGDRIGEIIVGTQVNLTPQIKIYSQEGILLASKKVFSHDHKIGLNIRVADLQGDGLPEIIVAPQNASDNKIRVYRYSLITGKIKLITTKKFYNNSQASGINIEAKDIDNDSQDEVIVGFSSNNGPLKIYDYKSKKLDLKTQLSIEHTIITGIAAGDLDNKGNMEIALATVSNDGLSVLSIYRLKNEQLNLVKQKEFKKQNFSGYTIKMGDLTGDFKDEIILSPLSSLPQLKIYTYDQTKTIKIFDKISPYGQDFFSGINIGLIDADNNWNLELVTAPLSGSSHINIYDYFSGSMDKISSFYGFASDFTGGVSL